MEGRSVFRMNLFAGLSTLDPAYASDQSGTWMCKQLYNGLLELGPTLGLEPGIAHDWELSEDGLTYTFRLRQDVWFHKDPLLGPDSTRRVKSSDFVYSFTRLVDPAVAAKGAWLFNDRVEGVQAYKEGLASSVSGFQAPDDSTLVIRLVRPFAPFPNLLTMAYASVVPREVVQRYGKDFRSHPIGTGPFRFGRWEENVSLVLLRNESYFEREGEQRLPYLDAVHVRFIRERLTEFIEFKEGRLDFINGLDKTVRDEICEPGGSLKESYRSAFAFESSPQLNTEFIAVLVDSTLPAAKGHPLMDLRVRQALNMAIDKESLVKYVLNGHGFPARHGLVPLGFDGYPYDRVKGSPYHPDSAARLLAVAGYPGGKGLPTLSLNSVPAYQPVMEYVQKAWERLGLTVKIENSDGSTLRERASKGEINLWRAGWIADYVDPGNYLGLLGTAQIPPNGPNRMRYSLAEVDSLLALAEGEADDAGRMSLYAAAEQRALADQPLIPLYYDAIVRLISHNVQGLETNATNMLYLARVKKQP